LIPRAAAVVVFAIAAAMVFLVFEQRAANERILSTLDEVNAALASQTTRSRELGQQVVMLTERVESLDKEVVDLRRRVATLSRRPVEVARHAPPAMLESVALAPLAPWPQDLRPSGPQNLVIEILPITWSTDWRSFQPAGIIAPPAPIVLQRKLTDPAFVKKLYVSYAALQTSDIITTTIGLNRNRNAREANPFLRDISRSPAALIGVKAATTVATIVAIEKLRQRHPVVASVTLIAMNATLAAVTINNVSVAAAQNRAKP
jgi:hypothetical protein